MKTETIASIGLVVGGALWGLYWLPLRALEDLGLPGGWAGLVVYGGAVLGMLALLATGRFPVPKIGGNLILCGLLTGAAFSCYSTSLTLTEVVRAILLFYLTPVWGTLLGLMFLGERLTLTRVLALLLAFAGLLVVLGAGDTVPLPRNMGDWLALMSGMFWALGSLRIYQSGNITPFDQVFAFVFGSFFVTSLTMLIAPDLFATGGSAGHALRQLPWGLLMALYVLPMLFLTIWPASLLTPGRVGVLLMSDVIVGVFSAAALAGEPFGWRETAGSILIIAAAVVEVLGKSPVKPNPV